MPLSLKKDGDLEHMFDFDDVASASFKSESLSNSQEGGRNKLTVVTKEDIEKMKLVKQKMIKF